MDTAILDAGSLVFLDPKIWGIVLLAAIYGVFVGSTPGLTATMATALLVPITYWMDPVPALAAIVTMVACAIFAGDIPTALVRIPGTPASAAYVDDMYGFTRRGQPERALGVALACSVAGGLFGAFVLMLLGQQLARAASFFSRVEYFWLYLLGLSCAVLVARSSVLHAMAGLLIGLLLSTVGLSAVHAEPRFTFGIPELFQGINFIPAMIGLFGVSEVLRNLLRLESTNKESGNSVDARESSQMWRRHIIVPLLGVMAGFGVFFRRIFSALRSCSIGAVIGMLPGAGADIAAWVSLAVSRRTRTSAKSEEEAPLDGVADATSANSSALAGSWIPALVFGIPGDSVTAIVLGVLLMKDIKPGPEIFQKQAALVYSIYLLFILANVALLLVGFLAIIAGVHIVKIPRRVLLPVILFFCVLGAFSINASSFDVGVMLIMGVMGFVLERLSVPLGPVVLGILLGRPLEERFVQTLSGSEGAWVEFFGRPGAAVLGAVCIVVWAFVLYRMIFRGKPA